MKAAVLAAAAMVASGTVASATLNKVGGASEEQALNLFDNNYTTQAGTGNISGWYSIPGAKEITISGMLSVDGNKSASFIGDGSSIVATNENGNLIRLGAGSSLNFSGLKSLNLNSSQKTLMVGAGSLTVDISGEFSAVSSGTNTVLEVGDYFNKDQGSVNIRAGSLKFERGEEIDFRHNAITVGDGATAKLEATNGDVYVKGSIKTSAEGSSLSVVASNNIEVDGSLRVETLSSVNFNGNQILVNTVDLSSGSRATLQANNGITLANGISLINSNSSVQNNNTELSLSSTSGTIKIEGAFDGSTPVPNADGFSIVTRGAVNGNGLSQVSLAAPRIEVKHGIDAVQRGVVTLVADEELVIQRNAQVNQEHALWVSDGGAVTLNAQTVTVGESVDDSIDTLAVVEGKNSTLTIAGSDANFNGNISASNSANIVFANKNTTINGELRFDNSASILVGLTDDTSSSIEVVNADNTALVGLNTDLDFSSFSKVTLNGAQKESGAAVKALDGASIVLDNAEITGQIMVSGKSDSGKASTVSVGEIGVVNLDGNVLASDEAQVHVTLGSGSIWSGRADNWSSIEALHHDLEIYDEEGSLLKPKSAGEINVTLTGGTWTVQGKSTVSSINFAESTQTNSLATSSMVDLSAAQGSSLVVDQLSGTQGQFRMFFDADPSKANMLYVKKFQDDTSSYVIDVVLDPNGHPEDLDGLRFATTISSEIPRFTVVSENQGFNNLKYEVKSEAYDITDIDNEKFNGIGTGEGSGKPGSAYVDAVFGTDGMNWYLGHAESTGPSDGGRVVLATAKADYFNAVEIDRFQKRMAERRLSINEDGSANGLWMRIKNDRIGTNSGSGDFRSRNYMYQVGYDISHRENDGSRICGVAFDYMDGDTEYRNISGDGSTDRFGVTAYSTWLSNSGWYWDTVAKWGVLSNSFKVSNQSNNQVSASYDNHAFGVSMEVGKSLQQAGSNWYFTPQAQLQYVLVTDTDYRTNQGTHIDHDQIHSVISRVGFVVGRTFGSNKQNAVYAKTDWFREWHGEQNIRVSDATTNAGGDTISIDHKGHWFDVGFGFQAAMTKQSYLYADIEHHFGNDLEKTWVFNAGARLSF